MHVVWWYNPHLVLSRARNSWTHWIHGEFLKGCLILLPCCIIYGMAMNLLEWFVLQVKFLQCPLLDVYLFLEARSVEMIECNRAINLMRTPTTVTLWWINVISLSLLSECKTHQKLWWSIKLYMNETAPCRVCYCSFLFFNLEQQRWGIFVSTFHRSAEMSICWLA